MSHELRTPLNAVIGFAQLLENQIFGSLGSTKYTEYARLIRESGSHLLAIINDILDLSKVEAGKIEMHESTVDAAALVREVASPFRLEAGIKRLGFAVEERRGLPALWADERMLRQILINLLSNAFKFTPAGGRVAIAAGCDRNGAPFFEVRDTGIGIAPEDMETALTPFGQVANVFTRQYQGTGLGLPLAKSFAELHGGLLTIDSTPGEGTTIRIVLPPERACRVAIA
ncbi:MAG: PAS domain-containing sensor histidine kinase, partial [Rhodospirillales bacterium]|nr:PAS domain-containing sensor histidine kinase [Rhodospirillales bacterium]